VGMIGRQPVGMWRWWGRSMSGSRKTWRECVKDDMDELGLHSEWVVFRDMWRSESGDVEKCLTLAERGRNGRFINPNLPNVPL